MPRPNKHRTFLPGSNLLRFQFVLLLIAIAICVLHWIFHAPERIIGTLIDTYVSGNVTILLILVGGPILERRPRPWIWIGYALLLVGAAIVANAALLPFYSYVSPGGVSFNRLILRDSPLILLIIFVVGIILFAFRERQARREARRLDLQRRLQSHVQLGLSEKHTPQTDLDQAHEIQVHLLPRETPQLEGFQIACAWQPALSVSGDYFDVLSLGKGQVGLCIADVSGKGVSAALLMANLQASVKAFAHEILSPAALCSKLNVVLCDTIAPGRFVTLFYAVLDEETRLLRYESAGHCLPLLVHHDGAVELLEAFSGVLGLFSHWTFSDHELMLASGDALLMMTDGVLEAWNAAEEDFGYKRLIDSVLASRAEGAHGIRKRVLEDVTTFCDGLFRDDASLIVVTVD
ncbi:MAG: PP2C family protein-serine/threonine phosphatase [Silvibacterium sp.]